MSEVPQLLDRAAGDRRAAADLLPLLYDELRALAAARLAAEPAGHTLQPTALVHEAFMRLVGSEDRARWDDRGHFFAAAAEAMRRVLVEHARRRHRLKRAGSRRRVKLPDLPVTGAADPERILSLDDALTRLAAEHPAPAALVRLHAFAGLSIETAADALGVSRATAYRDWTYARAWLRDALGG
jgi:RNA polymerase sigma factor (TIGR02999 family)